MVELKHGTKQNTSCIEDGGHALGAQRQTRKSQEEKKKRKEVSGHIRGTKNNDDVGRTKSKKENLGLSKEVDQIKLNDILKHNIFQLKHGRKTEHLMK